MHLQLLRKNTLVFFISGLLFLSSIARGQQYRIFLYNNLYGVTDRNAQEVIAPVYDWVRSVAGREEYEIFHPPVSSGAATLKFNMKTGSKDFFDRYYSNDILIQNESYSFTEQKGKQYLLNEKTGRAILLGEDFRSFENAGSRYIVAKFYPQVKAGKPKASAPKMRPAKQGKKGVLPPPPKIERLPPPPTISALNIDDYALLNNDTTMKILLHVKAAFLKPYYFFDESSNDKIDYNANPSGFVAGTGNSQTIYDSLLNPVKTLSLKLSPDEYSGRLNDEDEDILAKACTRTLGKKTVFSFPVYVSAPPVKRATDEEKPVKPGAYLSLEKEDGITQVYLNRTGQARMALFATQHKVKVDESDNGVHINPDDKTNTADFEVNMQTGKLLLPAKYIQSLGLKVF